MSRDDIATLLRGTKRDVQNAAKEIQTRFEQIRKGASASVASYTLHYEVGILRQFCCALQDNYHKYADMYCDIAAAMLPHVEPCPAKPEFWVSHLTSLQYIHHALCREQTIASCQRFYALITAQRVQLQSKTDYRFYLNMHIKHLYYFAQQLQRSPTSSAAKEQSCLVLQSLGALFKAMQPPSQIELMGELNMMLGKRSGSFLKALGTLPLEYNNKMYEPLFRLISANAGTAEELGAQFPEYLSAFNALLLFDGYAWPQLVATQTPPMALQLLRSCREVYKDQQGKNYAMQLLYYYLKLLYTSDPSVELKRPYIDLVKKLMHFFEHKSAAHAQEQWFIDYLMVFVRLQRQLHQIDNKTPSFDIFWQGLAVRDSTEAFAAHYQLLECLISMSMNISSTSPLAANCVNDPQCQSLRKHCIFTLGYCAVVAYRNWQASAGKETLTKASLKCLVSIIHYAMDVLRVTKCMSSSSVDVINFVWHLTNIADKVSNAGQMTLLQQLLKPLQQLRPLIGAQEMRQLLRRLYKASGHCEDKQLAAQLQCTYIVSIATPSRQFEQMCVYYRNLKSNATMCCIYALHEASPLCNPLTKTQQRHLYELDMLAVLGNKKIATLLQSLLHHRQSDYHLVLLGRHLRTDKQVLQQLEELRMRLSRSSHLSRLQQLVLGHASITKLVEWLEAQKTKIPIKEMAEKTLEEMLVKYNLLHVNLASELPLLQLATDAIKAFEEFYNRADAEPLASDEALIDWEALIDDAIVAAMALSTMGYMTQADQAWLLLLRVSRWLDDRFTYLRALSHFLSHYTQHPGLDLQQEVAHAQHLLDDLWPQLHSGWFFKRQHTTLLLCLCHMALYYARRDCLCHAQLLLVHAQRLRDEFDERVGKCDIIQLTLQSVRFRMGYQKRQCSSMPTTALQQLDTLAESVRNFSAISSQDNGALILLLSDLVQDITECTANRLSELPNLSSSLLQVLLQSGLVLRAVEVLISWLWTNLRMECLDKALSKLRLIEHFLCVESLSMSQQREQLPTSRSSSPSLLGHAPMDAQSKHMSELVGKMLSMQLEQGSASVEPIRKQQQLAQQLLSPRPPASSVTRTPLQLQRYVQPTHPLLCNNLKLQCIYFVVGSLHARLYFLNRDHEQLDEFYTLANDWLKQDPQRGSALGHMLLVLQLYQANYLRARHKYGQAIEISQSALRLSSCDPLQQHIDVNYRYNLLLQLRTAQRELHPQPVITTRRALKFNTSPEEKLPRTKASKSSNKVSSAASTKSARRPAKFSIYTEDASVLSSGSASSGSSPDLDLNSCQIIQVIDLSDDEPPQLAQLKHTKSAPRPATTSGTRITRTRTQKQAAETPVTRLPRVAPASATTPAETTPRTRATRPRRQATNVSKEPEPVTIDLVSSRRRQRN